MTQLETGAWISAREAGGLLGVTAHTIRRWAKQGAIPSRRLTSRTIRYSREAVLQFGRNADN